MAVTKTASVLSVAHNSIHYYRQIVDTQHSIILYRQYNINTMKIGYSLALLAVASASAQNTGLRGSDAEVEVRSFVVWRLRRLWAASLRCT